MISEPAKTVAFSGHRTYRGESTDSLNRVLRELYARGFRYFMTGMAVGFDLEAAETVLAMREEYPDIRLIAVVPFEGQQRRFPAMGRIRFGRVLSSADEVLTLAPEFYTGCYAARNNYLTEHAAVLVSWYDSSSGGTAYTIRQAELRGIEIINLKASARQADLPFK